MQHRGHSSRRWGSGRAPGWNNHNCPSKSHQPRVVTLHPTPRDQPGFNVPVLEFATRAMGRKCGIAKEWLKTKQLLHLDWLMSYDQDGKACLYDNVMMQLKIFYFHEVNWQLTWHIDGWHKRRGRSLALEGQTSCAILERAAGTGA